MAAPSPVAPKAAPRGAARQARYDAHAEFQRKTAAHADTVIHALELSDDELLHTYQQMLDIRHFEEQCLRAFRASKVGGYLHLYSGQEAVTQGVLHTFHPGDQALSTYRDHAHCIVLGSDYGKIMAEIYGKATGISRGKGGSMHLFDKEHGFAGGYGIVGGNVPLAVGLGWALKHKKDLKDAHGVCYCFLGDGSMNAGGFHEALNMAQLYELPILFVLENNKYAMGTSVERSHANTDLASRADSYAMANSKVDGQDYFAVRETAQGIVDAMRKSPAPYFLEAVTYRYSGHGAADGAATQSTYRKPEELDEWKGRDPINILATCCAGATSWTTRGTKRWTRRPSAGRARRANSPITASVHTGRAVAGRLRGVENVLSVGVLSLGRERPVPPLKGREACVSG